MSGLVATASSSAFISSAGRENQAENHAKLLVNRNGVVIKIAKPCAGAPNKEILLGGGQWDFTVFHCTNVGLFE